MNSPESASKVTASHLGRTAYLYVRQSTLRQVVTNTESTARQYALRGKAIALGWPEDQVITIDSDQGQSGASATDREGFQRLVGEVGMGHAGIVLGLEVSRLARNNADWHRLLEICGLTGTLICDEDGLYDPCNVNDRLLLGLKGQMSEFELHILRARLRGGIISKARRGELRAPLPVGLVYDPADRVVLDPDAGVQHSIRYLFATFERAGSAHAVVATFAAEGLTFPRRIRAGANKGELVWGALGHSRVLQVLHNPRYAGVFCFGRHGVRPGPNGPTTRLLAREEWVALIPDRHPGYLSFEQFEANQQTLAANAAAHGQERRAGPPREGPALLQGLVVCGRCGRRMTLRYHVRAGTLTPDYLCQAEKVAQNKEMCQYVQGAGVDVAVGALLVDSVTPLTLEVALAVQAELDTRAEEADRIRTSGVQRCSQGADLARRRYLAVDPANRLVAESLEADYNQALRELRHAEEELERARSAGTGELSEAQQARVRALATDFPALWADPATPIRERKRLVRLLIEDVTLAKTDQITVHVRFRGGTTTSLTLPTPDNAWQARLTPPAVVATIDELLDNHTEGEIAELLGARGLTTGEGLQFNLPRVQRIRRNYRLTPRLERLRQRGLLTLAETASALGVTTATVKIWRDAGLLVSYRINDKGECLYPAPGPNPPSKQQGAKLSARRLAINS
ncbi:MAG: recombinase family protein [Mycobacteriales bacterium]